MVWLMVLKHMLIYKITLNFSLFFFQGESLNVNPIVHSAVVNWPTILTQETTCNWWRYSIELMFEPSFSFWILLEPFFTETLAVQSLTFLNRITLLGWGKLIVLVKQIEISITSQITRLVICVFVCVILSIYEVHVWWRF